ncbi:protein ABHD11-like [Zerene cesonia]|uniref:protein ABHD11-like n=1 Tax=Zerene cesonia TaxID=33412 RepID=UPI0018E5969E|nr:protein ABHD11-like [Zerene cesonia]
MAVCVIRKSRFQIIPKFPLYSIRTAVKLSYKIFGESEVDPDDPPIFLFHDLLGTKKHWDSFGKTMVNMTKRSVVAVDLRNHGDSPHVSSHKYEDMAEDIFKLFKKLSVDKASIVGHGMGGRASMCVSLIAPEKVAGLLILDISPVSTCKHLEEFTKILAIIKDINFKEQKKICTAKRHAKKKLKSIIHDDTLMNVSRSAVDLAYKVHGNENYNVAPVIVIHGLLGMKKNWESVSKSINESTNKAVIAVDVRNHGESPHTESHTYPELASDISQLISKLSIKSSHVIGHSMGGRTGMVLALTEPAKVASLIVVDISPVSTAGILNDFFPKLIEVMKAVNYKGADNISKARSIAKEHLVKSGLVKAESSGFLLINVGLRPDGSYGWLCNLNALNKHFPDIATFPSGLDGKQYSGPTLFIGGEESNYLPRQDLPGIKKYFPNAKLEYVKDVGHNVHAEDPNAFLKIVLRFLS